MLGKFFKNLLASKWASRKLWVTISALVPLIFQMFNVSDTQAKALYGFGAAIVAAVYALAQAYADSNTTPPATPKA